MTDEHPRAFSNILVVSHENIGDIIMSSAVLPMLRDLYPEARITLRTAAACRDILFDPGIVDKVIGETVPAGLFARQAYKFAIWRHCRQERYAACFFLGHPRRSSLKFYKYAGIPVRVAPGRTLNGGESRSLLRHASHVIPVQWPRETHIVDYYQDIIQGYDRRAGRRLPYACAPAADGQALAPELAAAGEAKKVALCFRGGATNTHRWPLAYFRELMEHLGRKGCFLYAAAPPEDCAWLREAAVEHALPPLAVYETARLTSCAALLRQADLLVSVNTGQTHLAAALGVPVLSLTGKDGSSTYPYAENSMAISVVRNCDHCPEQSSCRARKDKRNPDYAPACVTALTPDRVIPYADRMLNGWTPEERLVALGF